MDASQLLPMVTAVAANASVQAQVHASGTVPVWLPVTLGVACVAALILWRRGA